MGNLLSNPDEMEKNEQKSDNETEIDNIDIPSVYVNADLFKFEMSPDTVGNVKKKYNIGGKIYEIDENMYGTDDESTDLVNSENFKQFKLYAMAVDNGNEEAEPNTMDIYAIAYDKGYIIDAKVYLSNHHFNTLIIIKDNYYKCFVCDIICREDSIHINSEEHKENIDTFLPLEEYGMSITRMKNEIYHCGVCNTVFYKFQCIDHYKGEKHEQNLLLAQKKVSDRNTINDRNRNNDMTENKENRINDSGIVRNEEVNECLLNEFIEIQIGNNVIEVPYLTWNMISISKTAMNKSFYCIACKHYDNLSNLKEHMAKEEHESNFRRFKINYSFDKHVVRQDNKFSHCGTCNTIHFLHDIADHIKCIHGKNTKAKPCSSKTKSNTEENRNNDKVLNKENRNNDKVFNTENRNNDKVDIENRINDSPGTTEIGRNKGNANNDAFNAIVAERCIVYLYGIKINVSMLSLNVVYHTPYGFYCALCKCNVSLLLLRDHLRSQSHIMMLNSALVAPQYAHNYIRDIHSLPHCGVCHLMIIPHLLINHLNDPSHVTLLNDALKMATQAPPTARIVPTMKTAPKVTENIINDVKINENKNNDVHQNENNDGELKNTSNDDFINETTSDDDESDSDVEINEITDSDEDNDGNTDNDDENNENGNNYADYDEIATILDSEVVIPFKKVISEISFTSFNTLVSLGDGGTRFCYLCEAKVPLEKLIKHLNSLSHFKLMKSVKFLEAYGTDLIRQKSSSYHCGLCNVILRRSALTEHIKWPIHEEQKKKMRNLKKNETKNPIRNVYATQKEVIFRGKEPEIKVLLAMTIVNKKRNVQTEKNKRIFLKDKNLKLNLEWNAWHSIVNIENDKNKCLLCQEVIDDINEHIKTENHESKLKEFLPEYFPTLIRRINPDKYHCVTCNTEINIDDKVVLLYHINTKKHNKKLKNITDNTSIFDDNNMIII